MSQLSPAVAIHLAAALGALVTGPVALWARRRGQAARPRLHRAFGYAWVTLMLLAAVSALFIPAQKGPTLGSFGPIHLLSLVTFGVLAGAFARLGRGDLAGHRRLMQGLYVGGCIVAGSFTLLPHRILGQLVWGSLGLA
jgi:uncharacterized membrane protein